MRPIAFILLVTLVVTTGIGATAALSQKAHPVFRDPFSFCRAVGTIDDPSHDRRYRGPASTRAMLTAAHLGESEADALSWRCANGRVLVCASLATTGCIKAPWTNPRKWAYLLNDPELRAECRRDPNAECPGATHCIAGCSGGVVIINSNQYPIDKQGYWPDEWKWVRQ